MRSLYISIATSLVFLSQPSFATQKRALATLASPSPSPSTDLMASLPVREITVTTMKEAARVGDFLSYTLSPGPGGDDAVVSPNAGGLKEGYVFRAGRILIPLAAGEHTIPALPIVDARGQIVAKTDPFQMNIASTIQPGADGQVEPAPARGPVGVSTPGWIQTLVAGVIVFVIGGIVFFLIRWSQRRTAALLKKILPKKPIDQQALDRLTELHKRGYIQKGQHKPFHFGISEALKEYLGARFEFDAQESTTSEMLTALNELKGTPGLDAAMVKKISDCFTVLDLVKFTDYVPSERESTAQHEAARQIVLATRRVSIETPATREVRA